MMKEYPGEESLENTYALENLTAETLASASALADELNTHVPGVRPSQSFAASLDREAYLKLYPDRTGNFTYWVLTRNTPTGKMAEGTIGIYETREDADEAVWLAWFCIAPEERRLGLGSRLLNRAIETARSQGKKFVRIDTANHPKERDALKLYEKMGFKIIRYREMDKGPDGILCQLLDMELKL